MFSLPNNNEVIILQGEYSTPIVLLSIIIACFASFTAISLNDRIQQNSFFHRNFWLTLASLAMGLGIWSMHFIGMAAFMLPVAMKYDVFITILSIIPAVIASFLAFYIANLTKRSVLAFILSGIIMGLGISTMHYVGMAAMKMDANYSYRPWIFFISICIAISVSLIAIHILSTKQKSMGNLYIKTLTSALLGIAVASMHYTGMKAMVFYVPISTNYHSNPMHEMNTTLLIVGVTIGILTLLCLSALSTVLDRYVDYRLNYFDAATKLPNRRQFEKSYKQTTRSRCLATLHIHNLETLNVDYGYGFGDDVIRTLSKMILQLAPNSADLYRMKGNRFTIVTNDPHDFESLKVAMQQITSIMQKPLLVNEQLIILKGVCAFSVAYKESEVEELLANTIAVLNHPTLRYENQVVEYEPTIHTYNFERSLVSNINYAMENNELYLVYQPKVCARTGITVGIEALLRWKHPVHGSLSPGIFIPLLEKSGKMFDVTDWIIEKVCQQIAECKSVNSNLWQVAINIPGPYVTSPRLITKLKNSIDKYGIDGRNIELEMTETSVVKNIDNAIRSVNIMRDYGFSVALDDFGTGVSSLSYLKRLPITTLKIDKSFIDGVPDSEKDSAILKAIISLSNSLNLNIVIEGVETEAQVDFLNTMPESLILQGYYYARPMKFEEYITWQQHRDGSHVLS